MSRKHRFGRFSIKSFVWRFRVVLHRTTTMMNTMTTRTICLDAFDNCKPICNRWKWISNTKKIFDHRPTNNCRERSNKWAKFSSVDQHIFLSTRFLSLVDSIGQWSNEHRRPASHAWRNLSNRSSRSSFGHFLSHVDALSRRTDPFVLSIFSTRLDGRRSTGQSQWVWRPCRPCSFLHCAV